MSSENEKFREWLHKEILDYEESKNLLTDSFDIFSYYYIHGQNKLHIVKF